jgi:hypothetical protein
MMSLRNASTQALATNGVGQSNTRSLALSDEVRKVTVQIRAPKGTFPGEVAIGHYIVFERNVILTDQDGKPIPGAAKQQVGPDGDARLIACRMVRNSAAHHLGLIAR